MKHLMIAFRIAACIFLSAALTPSFAARVNNDMTVLITGANRGIGLEFARQFTEKGYRVIGTARTPDEAHELHDLDVRIVQLDVTDEDSLEAMAADLQGTAIDILINNAGIGGQFADKLTEVDIDKVARTVDVNSLGPMRVTSALYDNLHSGEGRTVIQITSIMGSIELNDRGGFYGYRMSKAALNMFNRSLSHELGDEGFICIVLHPGWVQTDMGGEQAPLTPEESIGGMIKVIEGLDVGDNGRFYDYTGKELPW